MALACMHGRFGLGAAVLGMACGIVIFAGNSVRADIYCDDATKRYHTEDCQQRKTIQKKYLKIFHAEAEAESRGYYPCTICVTPARRTDQNLKQVRQLAKPVVRGREYIGDTSTHLYHSVWCPLAPGIKTPGRVVFKNVDKAAQQKFTPCPECNPPAVVKKTEWVPPPSINQTPLPNPQPGKNGAEMGLDVH